MAWWDRITNVLDLPERRIVPLVAVCIGFKRYGRWVPGWVRFGHAADQSLFYNGVFFCRFALPFFIGFGIRWSGSTTSRAFLQTYFGWKLNGQFSIVFRIQSDQSAAAGYTGPNYGQASGWNEGTK